MENVVLTVHLILALLMIGVVLLQRSEGGGLLSGGGSMSARGAANALTKVTWLLAIGFIATSITLTILAAKNATGTSVLDQAGAEAPAEAPADATAPVVPEGNLLPPSSDDAPAAPPPAE